MAKKALKKSAKKVPAKKGRTPIDVQDLILKLYYDAPKALLDEDLCKFLGISLASFYAIKASNIDFLEAFKHYKRISPIEVLNSFKKIAVGYSYDETEKQLKKQKNGKYVMTVTKITTKHHKPDATAGAFFLKNQMPEHFKDKIETVITAGAGIESITFTAKRRENG